MMEGANNKLTQVSNYKSDIWLEIDSFLDNISWKVDNILNFTKEEQDQLVALIKILKEIKKMIDSWKPFFNTMNYNIFILSYNKLDDKLKKYFVDIYKEFIIEVWKFKINRIINNKPMPSWFDEAWIKAEVINIISVDPNYDFSIFWNDLVNKIAKDWKYVTKKYWISF